MDENQALEALIDQRVDLRVKSKLAELAPGAMDAIGLGRPRRAEIPKEQAGLGCPSGACFTNDGLTAAFLEAGSARLAWAKAKGIPFAPFKIVVAGQFPTTGTALVPDNGNQDKLVQDTWIRKITYNVINVNPPANQFSSLQDFFYRLQSGILATLKVIGTPKYEVVPDFTPLDQIEGPAGMWILQLTNGLKMDFQASVTLPNPVTVYFTFHGETCPGLELINKSQAECLKDLQAMGYDTGCYERFICSR